MDLEEVGGCELDSFCSELRLLGLYGHSNKPTVFVKCRKFLEPSFPKKNITVEFV